MYFKVLSQKQTQLSIHILDSEWEALQQHFHDNRAEIDTFIRELSFDYNELVISKKDIADPTIIQRVQHIRESLEPFHTKTGLNIYKNLNPIKILTNIADQLLNNEEFDHNIWHKQNPFDGVINVKDPWVQIIHQKIDCLELMIIELAQNNQVDLLREPIDRLLHNLIAENKPFAPCLNSSLSKSLKLIFLLFPRVASTHIINRTVRFGMRFQSEDELSKNLLLKDIRHFTANVLYQFHDLRPYFFSTLSNEKNQIWDTVHNSKNQEELYMIHGPNIAKTSLQDMVELMRLLFLKYSKIKPQ